MVVQEGVERVELLVEVLNGGLEGAGLEAGEDVGQIPMRKGHAGS
jgi:hypothetical protein